MFAAFAAAFIHFMKLLIVNSQLHRLAQSPFPICVNAVSIQKP